RRRLDLQPIPRQRVLGDVRGDLAQGRELAGPHEVVLEPVVPDPARGAVLAVAARLPIRVHLAGEARAHHDRVLLAHEEPVHLLEGPEAQELLARAREAGFLLELAQGALHRRLPRLAVAHDRLPRFLPRPAAAQHLEKLQAVGAVAEDKDLDDVGANVRSRVGHRDTPVPTTPRPSASLTSPTPPAPAAFRKTFALSRVSSHSEAGTLSATMPAPTP